MTISVIVGVLTGVISSIAAWWVINHLMAPRIAFAGVLKKERTRNTKTGYYYQFKFGNMKRHSSAFDLSYKAVLYLREFPSKGVTNMYTVPTSANDVYELTRRKKGKIGWNRRITLEINDGEFIKIFDKNYFSSRIKELASSKLLTLEELLSIAPDSFIRVYVSAMDSFSGARRVFRSRDYKAYDVLTGQYDRSSLKFNIAVEGSHNQAL